MFEYLLSLFLIYKYIILFIVIFGASFGIPLPATGLLMMGWVFFAQWYLDGSMVFIVSLLACISWDILAYFLSRTFGKGIFYAIGIRKILNSDGFTEVEKRINKQGIILVFLSRFFFTAIGPIVNIISGISRMRIRSFIIADIAGEIVYVSMFFALGYVFWDNWELILSIFESTSIIIMSIVGISSIMYHIYKKIQENLWNN